MDYQTSQLLQQIADNTGQSDSIFIAIVAAAAGIFGAGLTVLGSYVMARMTRQTEDKRLRAGQSLFEEVHDGLRPGG